MAEEIIYFDHNSTTYLLPSVKDTMLELLALPNNPSSQHIYGRKANAVINNARKAIKDELNIPKDYSIIFTASGTESNNIALNMQGFNIITSCIEHHSVLKKVGQGIIPCKKNGVVDLKVIKKLLEYECKEKKLVSVMAVNNETGCVQPLDQIIPIIHQHQALLHTDASQAIGKISFDIAKLQPDLITISGHKFGAPQGSAALIFRSNLPIHPLIYGGGQEYRFRPGTQNVAAIAGIAAAIQQVDIQKFSKIKQLRDYMEEQIIKWCCDQRVIIGYGTHRLPNTSCIMMPGVSSRTQLIYFDINKICISNGAACSSGTVESSYVLMSMGYTQKQSECCIRVSLGLNNSKKEIDIFLQKWYNLLNLNK